MKHTLEVTMTREQIVYCDVLLRRNAITDWHSNLWNVREIFSGVLTGVGKNKRVSDDGVGGARG